MASIDKIYATKEQYQEFLEWCKKNKPDAIRYFYEPDDISRNDGYEHAITNFPEHIDTWLLKNCSLLWVVARISEQYGIEPPSTASTGIALSISNPTNHAPANGAC